jgi:hypothetical protein
MAERGEAARRPARAPLPRRSRKRWAVAAGVTACWVVLLYMTGSVIAATMLLALLAVLGVVTVLALRALGVTRDHPWIRQLATRPWRDGQDVLRLALQHLPEVFIITPSGSLLAPNVVELRMNPADLRSLTGRMDLSLVIASAAEVYEEHAAAHDARFAGHGPVDVRVIPDASVPPGRYQLRQGQPVDASPHPGAQFAYAGSQISYAGGPYPGFEAHDGSTRGQPAPRRVDVAGMPTVMEELGSQIPVLRLVTGAAVAQTRVSGARAGRGPVELGLPDVPTVSRVHARFTFSDGQWWIGNLGRNGLTLNGAVLAGEHPLGSGDSIRWGTRSDALQSRVEIG